MASFTVSTRQFLVYISAELTSTTSPSPGRNNHSREAKVRHRPQEGATRRPPSPHPPLRTPSLSQTNPLPILNITSTSPLHTRSRGKHHIPHSGKSHPSRCLARFSLDQIHSSLKKRKRIVDCLVLEIPMNETLTPCVIVLNPVHGSRNPALPNVGMRPPQTKSDPPLGARAPFPPFTMPSSGSMRVVGKRGIFRCW